MRRVPVIRKGAFFPAAEPNALDGGSLLLAQIAVHSIFIFTGNVVQRQMI
jgi:hypothetical protein